MQTDLPAAALETIEFPRQTALIKRLRYISFAINDLLILISLGILFIWITNFPTLSTFLFHKVGIFRFAGVPFLFSGTALFFGARRHLAPTSHDGIKDNWPWWNTLLPILLAVVTSILGLLSFIHLTNTGYLSFFRVSPFAGFNFFLIGLSLIPPFTRLPHRFHITQFLIFIVGSLSVFTILEKMYQLFSPLPAQYIVSIPLATSITFSVFSLGILLRWSNRGFLGNFTLDSAISMLAMRLFLVNLLAAPITAFIVLAVLQKSNYNMYQILALVVAYLTFISSTVLWANVKLLYQHELEHLLMRESLRTHNIDLIAEKEALRKRMAQLEQEKQQYKEKLNTQATWSDAAEILR